MIVRIELNRVLEGEEAVMNRTLWMDTGGERVTQRIKAKKQ